MKKHLRTAESVSEGHPDKIADQISDAVLDAIIAIDPNARVACETLVKTGMVLVAGEITTHAWVDIEAIVRQTVRDIGYTSSDMGFDWESCAILTAIGKQSVDIAQGVNGTAERALSAGDQGMMYGYATIETNNFMPAPIEYAHKLMLRQAELRKRHVLPWLRPDAKAQVTMCYEKDEPVGIDTIVLSTQHDPSIELKDLEEAVIEEIIKPIFPTEWLENTSYLVNPSGRFVVGGPLGDCGLTGRKIMVDSYGGLVRHGGGCFSGKDLTKVDRTGAYFARYIAKNIVASGLAAKCEVALTYAIGLPKPLSFIIDTQNTGEVSDEVLTKFIEENFDLNLEFIIHHLNLIQPIYKQTAAYGHFGRSDVSFPWERLDLIQWLQSIH